MWARKGKCGGACFVNNLNSVKEEGEDSLRVNPHKVNDEKWRSRRRGPGEKVTVKGGGMGKSVHVQGKKGQQMNGLKGQ